MHLVQIISPAPFSNKELSLPHLPGLTLEVSQSLSVRYLFLPVPFSIQTLHCNVCTKKLSLFPGFAN